MGLLIILSACVDYQEIKIDNKKKEISIISSDSYVVDSIVVERFGKVFFSKSLKDKTKGSSSVLLDDSDQGYEIKIDSLAILNCDTDNLSLDVIIRKKGSPIEVTNDIAKGFKFHDDIQILRGLKYEHCSKHIDTFKLDRRIR